MDARTNTVCKMNRDFRWGAAIVVLAVMFSVLYTVIDLMFKLMSYV